MSDDLEPTDTEHATTQRTGGAHTRRVLLTGAGAVGATVVLAACGSDPAETTTPPAAGGPTTGAATTGPATTGAPAAGPSLAKASSVPVGGGVILADQKLVITQPTEGAFKAFSSLCTHKQCPVSQIDGGTINCMCHGSKFSIEDGSVKAGPANAPLEPKQVKKEGDDIVAA